MSRMILNYLRCHLTLDLTYRFSSIRSLDFVIRQNFKSEIPKSLQVKIESMKFFNVFHIVWIFFLKILKLRRIVYQNLRVHHIVILIMVIIIIIMIDYLISYDKYYHWYHLWLSCLCRIYVNPIHIYLLIKDKLINIQPL